MAEGRMAEVRRVGPDQTRAGQPTPGMQRREAVVSGEVWAGLVHTDVGATSGWHHHGSHESVLYVTAGALRVDFVTGDGVRTVQGGPGDFLHVPPYVVHREGNPTPEPSAAVVFRSGAGEVVVNVAGPAAAAS